MSRDKLIAWIDDADTDKDGFITTREFLEFVATGLRRWAIKEL